MDGWMNGWVDIQTFVHFWLLAVEHFYHSAFWLEGYCHHLSVCPSVNPSVCLPACQSVFLKLRTFRWPCISQLTCTGHWHLHSLQFMFHITHQVTHYLHLHLTALNLHLTVLLQWQIRLCHGSALLGISMKSRFEFKSQEVAPPFMRYTIVFLPTGWITKVCPSQGPNILIIDTVIPISWLQFDFIVYILSQIQDYVGTR